MAMILKQSTAFTFRFGPFVDSTDGFTEENALTIASTAVLLSKGGGAFAAKNDTTALTGTGASAHYTCVLNATDTNTVGTLRAYANVAGALPVFQDFYVVEEAVYDALFGASALGYVVNAPVNVVQISGDAVAADNAEAWFDGTGYTNTSNNIGSVSNVTGNVGGNVVGNVNGSVGSVGTNGITAATLATDAGTEIAQAVMGLAVSGNTGAGTFGAAINDVNLRGSRTVVRGTVSNSTTPSATQFTSSGLAPAGSSVDQFKGRIIVFDNDTTTVALRGAATDITASTAATNPLFTFSTLPAAPANGDTFSIV